MPVQADDDIPDLPVTEFDDEWKYKWPILTDVDFWSDQAAWPDDQPGYVFLARAFDEVGRAMFGEHWTGTECSSPLKAWTDPGLVARLAAVQQQIAKRCNIGNLVLAVRPVRGGEMTKAPRDWWNTEQKHYRERFYACQIDPSDPFGEVRCSATNSWIYVTRASLDSYLAGRPFAPKVSLEVPSRLSPYLKVMLAVVSELKITPDNQPLKKTIEHAMQEEWTKLGHQKKLGKALVGYMATCVREIESRGGRRKKLT